MKRSRWTIVVAGPAKSDFDDIIRWTIGHFGTRQARSYAATLNNALAALRSGPRAPGARQRDDIGPGMFTLHVARGGRRGRHLILFRVMRDEDRRLEVLRVLHDRIDITQQEQGE